MSEENMEKIQEAEIEQLTEVGKRESENNKMDVYIELALIFILGILIGIVVKIEATKKITIGFNDYQMKIVKQDFDINKLQLEVVKKNSQISNEGDDNN